MAQVGRMSFNRENSQTVQQLLHSDSQMDWNMPSSTSGKPHDQEDHIPRSKKLSILAKMKEKAKKLRQSLVRKRHGHDSNNAPSSSWNVSLENYEVEEHPEHQDLYQSSELGQTPGSCQRKSQLQSRTYPNVSTKTATNSGILNYNHSQCLEPLTKKNISSKPTLTKSHSDDLRRGKPTIPKMKLKETLIAQSFGNHQHEKFMSSNNVGEEEKGKRKQTVEDVIGKNSAYEKGKFPVIEKDNQDLEQIIDLKKGDENEASTSINNEENHEEKDPITMKNVAGCKADHEGTSKIQDVIELSSANGPSSSSQMPLSIDAHEVEDANQGKVLQTN